LGRGGRQDAREDGPERRCIASGASAPASGLIRFVVGPEGQVVPDLLGRLPGRGIWVTADRDALARAVEKKLFARAARRPVEVPADLAEQVEAGLARRVIELISVARKAGVALAGFEKVKAALADGSAAALIQAADGSDRGKAKLRPPDGGGHHVTCLSAAEIGLAFGREHVIHAALTTGRLATRVVEEAARLSGVRGIASSEVGRSTDPRSGAKGVEDV
jgi:predicted RNA-binding protein YlxR (DUF448 family)